MKITSFVINYIPTELSFGLDTPSCGDARYGLNIMKVLLERGYDVYTFPEQSVSWSSKNTIPSNLHISEYPVDDYVILGYVSPEKKGLIEKAVDTCKSNCVLSIFTIFEPYLVEYLPNIVNTHAAFAYKGGKRYDEIKQKTRDVYCLPYIVFEPSHLSGYDNNSFFWSTKGGVHSSSTELLVRSLLDWIYTKMYNDDAITLDILAWIMGVPAEGPTLVSMVKNHPYLQRLINDFLDRINVHTPIPYTKFRHMFFDTKLTLVRYISPESYGSGIVESINGGVPVIQYREGALYGCEHSLYLDNPSDISRYMALLDRLYNDRDFYDSNLEVMQTYVQKNFSVGVFLEALENIVDSNI